MPRLTFFVNSPINTSLGTNNTSTNDTNTSTNTLDNEEDQRLSEIINKF